MGKLRPGDKVNGEWHQVMRWVEVERLSPRSEAVPEVDGD